MWPQYRLNLPIFCVFGVGSQNFPLKNFSHEVDFGGGADRVIEFWGEYRWDRPKMGGASIWRPKGADFVHPPPLGVYDTFPKCQFLKKGNPNFR
jgi:hypothetical protein